MAIALGEIKMSKTRINFSFLMLDYSRFYQIIVNKILLILYKPVIV